MTRTVYYTATTLDGYLADEHDSLDWLFVQDHRPDGPMGFAEFEPTVGVQVMGRTTYEWIRAQAAQAGEEFAPSGPVVVFTHRPAPPGSALPPQVRFVSGAPAGHHGDLVDLAGGKDIWLVGGGELAGQFAEAGLLDQVMVSIAPVTLGAGRPLLPRRWSLRLDRLDRNGAFICAWYDVLGPGDWPVGGPSHLDGTADRVDAQA